VVTGRRGGITDSEDDRDEQIRVDKTGDTSDGDPERKGAGQGEHSDPDEMQGDERVEDMKTKKAGRQVQRDARMCVASMCCEYVHEEDVWQSMASAKPARGTPQASEPSKSWSTSIHGVMTRLRKSGESHDEADASMY
jgi:hypothetical protein